MSEPKVYTKELLEGILDEARASGDQEKIDMASIILMYQDAAT